MMAHTTTRRVQRCLWVSVLAALLVLCASPVLGKRIATGKSVWGCSNEQITLSCSSNEILCLKYYRVGTCCQSSNGQCTAADNMNCKYLGPTPTTLLKIVSTCNQTSSTLITDPLKSPCTIPIASDDLVPVPNGQIVNLKTCDGLMKPNNATNRLYLHYECVSGATTCTVKSEEGLFYMLGSVALGVILTLFLAFVGFLTRNTFKAKSD